MPIFNNYCPDNVDVIFKGIPIIGFAEGTFIEVEREVDTFTKKVGSLGDVARTRSLNKSGKITITLMDGHPVNDALAVVIASDEDDGNSVGSFTLKDRTGLSVCRASDAWCMKVPKLQRAQHTGNVVYVFEAASILIRHSGSVLSGSNISSNIT